MRIFDGHNDSLTRLYPPRSLGKTPGDLLQASDEGHLDLPRAQASGLAGGLFAIFIDEPEDQESLAPQSRNPDSVPLFLQPRSQAQQAPPLPYEYASLCTKEVLSYVFAVERSQPQAFQIVKTPEQLLSCLEEDRFAMVLHLEGAEAIDRNLWELELFYQAGVRSIGLVWSRPNLFGNGVPFCHPCSADTGPGLTPIGRNLVRRCNDLGIMLDLAHLNENGFYDVAGISSKPLVVSHSAAHALCHSSRNLTDNQLRMIAASHGIVGITFHVGDLREDGAMDADTPLQTIVDHIVYIAKLIGTDNIGLGSDFDGALIPDELKDVTGLPKLVELLQEAGFNEEEMEKILWRNWVRVLCESWS